MADRREILVALERLAERVIVKLELDIVANLSAAPSEGGTPVDTGWARANWIPSIGRPFEGVSGSREAVNAGAQAAGQAQVLGYRLPMGPAFVSNNVPYILALNDGHSPQADPQFIERAIDKAVYEDLKELQL